MYPKEYIEFLVHFHGDRDYFECHEVLEEYWKKTDPHNKKSIWVGLILLAVANYHHRRKNFSGAKRTLDKSIHILKINDKELERLGIDANSLLELLKTKLKYIAIGIEYSSFSLPITNQSLLESCKEICRQNNLSWCEQSDIANKELIHRHALRDRSAIIRERLSALKKGRE